MKHWIMGLVGWLALASIADVTRAQFSGGGSGPSTAQLEKGCYGGNPTDCDSAGLHYFDGKYAPKDFKRANALFQRACDGGEPSGCYNLGWSYQNGFGVSENRKTAALFFQRACDGGDAYGCAQLAFSYAIADGIKQDDAKAAIYAERACNGNAALGCYVLAGAYYRGVPGYPKDINRAVTLFRRACNARYPSTSACKRLDELGYPRTAYVAPSVAQVAPVAPPPAPRAAPTARPQILTQSPRPIVGPPGASVNKNSLIWKECKVVRQGKFDITTYAINSKEKQVYFLYKNELIKERNVSIVSIPNRNVSGGSNNRPNIFYKIVNAIEDYDLVLKKYIGINSNKYYSGRYKAEVEGYGYGIGSEESDEDKDQDNNISAAESGTCSDIVAKEFLKVID